MSPDEIRPRLDETAALDEVDSFVEERAPAGDAPVAPAVPVHARTWLILGLLLAGLLHAVGAGLWTRIIQVPISAQFGLFQLLPAPYWVGMGLMGLAMGLAIRERSDVLVVVTGAVFLAVLAGTPNLFEPNPSNWDAYFHFSEAEMILATGHLPSVNLGQYSANWPGMFLLVAMLASASGVPVLTLVALHPFVAGALTFLAIFAFLQEVFPSRVAAPGSVLTSLFAVWAQYHLSPQSLGFVLALLLLAFVWRRGIRWRAACTLVFGGLVVLHPTSTILVLAILAVMAVLSLLWGRSSPAARAEARSLRLITLAYGSLWFGWLYFHATASYEVAKMAVIARMGQLISLPEATVQVAAARTTGNLLPVAPLVRLASLAIYGLVGCVSLLILLRSREHRRLGWFLLSGLLASAALAGADLAGLGGQFYDRSLLMVSVLAPGMCLTGIPRIRIPAGARHALVVVLVVASVTAASTGYYLEAFNEVSDRSIALANFVQRVPAGSAVIDGLFPPPIWKDPATWTPYTGVKFFTIFPATPMAYGGTVPSYEVFDSTSMLWYQQWLGINVYQSYTVNQTEYSRIYDNGEAAVYFTGG